MLLIRMKCSVDLSQAPVSSGHSFDSDVQLTSVEIKERFHFGDLGGKTGPDAQDDNVLGHEDKRTFHRHYKRRSLRVTALRSKILGNRWVSDS